MEQALLTLWQSRLRFDQTRSSSDCTGFCHYDPVGQRICQLSYNASTTLCAMQLDQIQPSYWNTSPRSGIFFLETNRIRASPCDCSLSDMSYDGTWLHRTLYRRA